MNGIETLPFWTERFPRPPDLKPDSLPGKVDVAIVGGGYTGLNAARVIGRSGGSVAVLEQETIGWGASSRNGGMTTTGLKAAAKTVSRRYGRALGRGFWQASLEAIDLIETITQEENIECDFERRGHVALATKPAHYKQMQAKAVWFRRELGHEMEAIGREELQQEIGADVFYGGLRDAYSGSLNPAKYVYGLARAAAAHGACLCENTRVLRIERQDGRFEVHTTKGVVRAREVLLATNGYTGGLVRGARRRIFPVGSYIIVTEPLPEALQQELSPRGRMFYTSNWFLHYFRLTPDGRMLFGGRNNLSTGLDLEESAQRLRRSMESVFPQLEKAEITHSWSGRLGLTFDLMPHIGRVDGVHYAMGYCGHGVSIATYLGTEAGLLLSGQKRSSPFAQIEHGTKFFYHGAPWFLPLAAAYYRFLDWIS